MDIIGGLRIQKKGGFGLETAEGIVLLDEIGSHLHPRWRMHIVTSFRRAFPRLQFLASTHDPLCLRGLENGEAVVLRRSPRGRVFRVPDLPPVKGQRVDQLLTSDFFGLHSTRDPQVESDFIEYYRLLALRNPSPNQLRHINELKLKLTEIDLPGTTRRERMLLKVIDGYLAHSDNEPDLAVREDLRTSTQKKL